MYCHNAAFKIDDSTITEIGFTHRGAYPAKFTGNRFLLTNTDTLRVKVYSNDQTGQRFAVGFGQFFGKGWIHVESEESGTWDLMEYAKEEDTKGEDTGGEYTKECAEQHAKQYAKAQYDKMLARAPEHARSMDKARSGGRFCVIQTHFDQLALRTCVMWQSGSGENGVKLEMLQDPSFDYVSGEWMGFDVDVSGIFPVSAHYCHNGIDITVHRK